MELTKLNAYWRLFRPKTSISTVFPALGGPFYGGNPLYRTEPHIPILILLGVALAHFSVNALNDYMDYKSGLDFKTHKTPFSGGSKVIVEGLVSPGEALMLSIITLALAIAIGIYLTLYRGLLVIVLALMGAFIIASYNGILVKIGLGELSLTVKGVLVFLGALYTVTGTLTPGAALVGLVYGMLSTIILYANFIPDIEADRSSGRITIPIILGRRSWIGYLFLVATLGVLIITVTLLNLLNPLALLALIPLTLTPKIAMILKDYDNLEKLAEALALNIKITRAVQIIVTTAMVIQAIFLI